MPQPVQPQVHSGGVVVAPERRTWLERFGTGLGQLAQVLSTPFSIMDMMEKTEAYKAMAEAQKQQVRGQLFNYALQIRDPEERRDALKALGVMSDEDLERYYTSSKESPTGMLEGEIKTEALRRLYGLSARGQAASPVQKALQQEQDRGTPSQALAPPTSPPVTSPSVSSGVQTLREVLTGKPAVAEVKEGKPVARTPPTPEPAVVARARPTEKVRDVEGPPEPTPVQLPEVEPVEPTPVQLPAVSAPSPAKIAKTQKAVPVEPVPPTPVSLEEPEPVTPTLITREMMDQAIEEEANNRASQPVPSEVLKRIEASEEFQDAKAGFEWLSRHQPDFLGPYRVLGEPLGTALHLGLASGIVYDTVGTFLSQVPADVFAVMMARTEDMAQKVLDAYFAGKGLVSPPFSEAIRMASILQRLESGPKALTAEDKKYIAEDKKYIAEFDSRPGWYKKAVLEAAGALRAMQIDANRWEAQRKAIEADINLKEKQGAYYETKNATDLEVARMQADVSRQQLEVERARIAELSRQFDIGLQFKEREMALIGIPSAAAEMLKAKILGEQARDKAFDRINNMENAYSVEITELSLKYQELLRKASTDVTHPLYNYFRTSSETERQRLRETNAAVRDYLSELTGLKQRIDELEAERQKARKAKLAAAARLPGESGTDYLRGLLIYNNAYKSIKFKPGETPIPTRDEYIEAVKKAGGTESIVGASVLADQVGLSLRPQQWNPETFSFEDVNVEYIIPDNTSDYFLNKVIIPAVRSGRENALPKTKEDFIRVFTQKFRASNIPEKDKRELLQVLPKYWEHYELHRKKVLFLRDLVVTAKGASQ